MKKLDTLASETYIQGPIPDFQPPTFNLYDQAGVSGHISIRPKSNLLEGSK